MGESDTELFGRCREVGYCSCGGRLGCDQERLATGLRFAMREDSDTRQLFGVCRTRGQCDPTDCGLCPNVPLQLCSLAAKATQSAEAKKRWIKKREFASVSNKSS
jgi:hypothetical protein